LERIESYLTNKMSAENRQAFEHELGSNPELQNEVDFQRDIIEGIKSVRMQELKTMMNNIPTGGSSWWSSSFNKVAVITVAGLIIGSVVYFNSDSSENAEKITENPVVETMNDSDNLLNSNPNDLEENANEIPAEDPSKEQAITDSSLKSTKAKKDNAVAVFTPDEVKPGIVDSFDENVDTDFSVPENELMEKSSTNSEGLAIEVISGEKKHNFHYQIKNSALKLYGEFDDTYEILDIIRSKRRAVYLFYKNQYYPLVLSQKEITPLKAITDQELVNSLEKIRMK